MSKPNYEIPTGKVLRSDPFEGPPMAISFNETPFGESKSAGRALVQASFPERPSELIAAFEKAGLTKKVEGRTVLHATRADRPRYVLDAKPFGKCAGCGEACWLSPSSLRAMVEESLVVVCDGCVDVEIVRKLLRNTVRR